LNAALLSIASAEINVLANPSFESWMVHVKWTTRFYRSILNYFLTVKTGILDVLITLSATLPSKNRGMPLSQCAHYDQIKDCSSASLNISSAGCPSQSIFQYGYLLFCQFLDIFTQILASKNTLQFSGKYR
jgi:hypothetical protein